MTVNAFVGCSQDIRNLKISGAMTFCPSVKVSWTDFNREFYDRPQELEMCLQHLVMLICTDDFWPLVTKA